MEKPVPKSFIFFLKDSILAISIIEATAYSGSLNYNELIYVFDNPDKYSWGKLSLWGWEADSLDWGRLTWQF